jgi:hypothetical protein
MILDRHRLLINIDRYLTHLLQPLYNHYTKKQTFENGTDALNAIQLYAHKGCLQSDTLFVNLHIHNLSTNIPYENLYTSLQRFLIENKCDDKLEGLTMTTVLQLVRLCLEQRYLLYERKIYQQIKGGAINSPLNMLLANIFLYYWQQNLVKTLKDNNEIFGR